MADDDDRFNYVYGAPPSTPRTSYNLSTPPEAVANIRPGVPLPAAANPFISGFNMQTAAPNLAPAAPAPTRVLPQVGSAAEAYQQLGPEASEAEREAALADYRNALNAEKWKDRYSPERWNEFADTKSRYDDWFREHVTAPYNDPNRIGNAQLFTDESGQRRMEIPSVLEEQAARVAVDDVTREYGDLRRVAAETRKKNPALAAKLTQQANKLQRELGVGRGYDALFAKALQTPNELSKKMAEREEIASRGEETEEQTRAARQKVKAEQEEAEQEEDWRKKRIARAQAYG